MQNWSSQQSKALFGVSRWGATYFDINDEGQLVYKPGAGNSEAIPLVELIPKFEAMGLNLPILVRFEDILTDRVKSLCAAFDTAQQYYGYTAKHTVVYPIKVNQQRCVVEHILQSMPGRVGLEAGSKPELMAILAQTFQQNNVDDSATIICNGYKDKEYIRLALIGSLLGKHIFIVIEQLQELKLILQQSAELNVVPRLGVRVRLSSVAKGRWQNSGGEFSKFGLSLAELLTVVQSLDAEESLAALQMLHFHIGSQVADLEDIKKSIHEIACCYQELYKLGVPIDTIDVGGGLGVDYVGLSSKHEFSMDYTLESYAEVVVSELTHRCERDNLPLPNIITESGRAVTAHHAVLITNVIDTERKLTEAPRDSLRYNHSEQLINLVDKINATKAPSFLQRYWQECEQILMQGHQEYLDGHLNIQQRSVLEKNITYCLKCLQQRFQKLQPDCESLEILNKKLADKVFCNFSVFQSVPDVWGLNQVFPILPLQRLDEAMPAHAVLHDLTCDSDGQITNYANHNAIKNTLPIHSEVENPYYIGIFLVGAYQEILGDMHNLFGDTNSVNVAIDKQGAVIISGEEPGDSVNQLLEYVHYDIQHLLDQYRHKLAITDLEAALKEQYFDELKAGLYGYAYLED